MDSLQVWKSAELSLYIVKVNAMLKAAALTCHCYTLNCWHCDLALIVDISEDLSVKSTKTPVFQRRIGLRKFLYTRSITSHPFSC